MHIFVKRVVNLQIPFLLIDVSFVIQIIRIDYKIKHKIVPVEKDSLMMGMEIKIAKVTNLNKFTLTKYKIFLDINYIISR